MKSIIMLAATAAMAAISVFAAEPVAYVSLGQFHSKMGMKATGEGPKMADCLQCHGGSYAALAKKSQAVKPNPHYNHYGDRDCKTCHKWSTKPVLSCDECHKFKSLKMPRS